MVGQDVAYVAVLACAGMQCQRVAGSAAGAVAAAPGRPDDAEELLVQVIFIRSIMRIHGILYPNIGPIPIMR